MASATFSVKVTMIKETNKVLYAEIESGFANVLLSFLTLPLGTIVRLLMKHYGDDAPILGSLNSLYAGLQNLDDVHFWTKAGKQMLLNPRNSSEDECSRLKLLIDDPPPVKFYMCGNRTCVSTYDTLECLCPSPTTFMRYLESEAENEDESIFTTETASFLLTDDLQIFTNTFSSLFRISGLNGIEDTTALEERTLIVGFEEMMELLKGSLVSKTPLTDIVLGTCAAASSTVDNEKKVSASAKREPETQTGKNTNSDSKKITVKALVQKSTNRVLLVETREGFVDFLFSLLTIPLGRVMFLLGNNTCLGSIHNLYSSISDSEIVENMKSREVVTSLLEPQLPPYYLSSYQIFSLNPQSPPVIERYKRRKNYRIKSVVPGTSVSGDNRVNIIDPKGQDSFVKGPRTFTVTDDLVVSTSSSTINRMKIPLSDVEQQELRIGMQEALSILKACLTSTCALNEGLKPFLKKRPKQEK